MAGEIYISSNPGPADFLATATAARFARLMLGSRLSLRNAPWLVRTGVDLVGVSGGVAFPLWKGMGTDLMSAVAENASGSNTGLTTDTITISPADYILQRNPSDKARRRDQTGVLDPMNLAMDGVAAAGTTLTDLIAQEVDGLTQVGTTGVDFTHDTFLDGQAALKQSLVPGPYACMLKPKQFTDWQRDLESRGGLTQWTAAAAEMQMLRGEGYEGNYNGIDVLTCDRVQSANSDADWAGAMWGLGCVAYQEEAQAPRTASQIVMLEITGEGGAVVIRCAEQRDESGRMTKYITHYSVGTGIMEALRGRTLISSQ